jgi:hypothetical protein
MTIKFNNPVEGSDLKGSIFSKKVTFDAPSGTKVVMPYAGRVISHQKNTCKDNVSLQHNINGETYYSFFCNVIKDPSAVGTLSEGESLGVVGSSNTTLEILNSNGNKLDTETFFSGFNNKENDDELDNTKTFSTSSDVDPKVVPFLKAASFKQLLPFHLIQAGLSGLKSKKSPKYGTQDKEENVKLKEEIERIKSLLK